MDSINKLFVALVFLCIAFSAQAQIPVATNFEVNTALPIDTRDTLTTLADTALIASGQRFPGLLSYVRSEDAYWHVKADGYWYEMATANGSAVADSLTVHRTDINQNITDITSLNDSITVHRTDINANTTDITAVQDSITVHRTDIDNNYAASIAYADTLQRVFEIGTVADTSTIASPREGDQAITTVTCGTRLVYTGAQWNTLRGVVITNPVVQNSVYAGSEDSLNTWTPVNIFAQDYTEATLRSLKVDGVEVLPDSFRYEAGAACDYASIDTLISNQGVSVRNYLDQSSCTDQGLVSYNFQVDSFSTIEYITFTPESTDTVTVAQDYATRDTFLVNFTAASVSDVENVTQDNPGVEANWNSPELEIIARSDNPNLSIVLNFGLCNGGNAELPILIDPISKEIILTKTASALEGVENRVPTYKQGTTLQDPITSGSDIAILPKLTYLSNNLTAPVSPAQGAVYYQSSEQLPLKIVGDDLSIRSIFSLYTNNDNVSQYQLSGDRNSGGLGYNAQRSLSGSNNSGGIGYNAQYQLSGNLNSGGIGYRAQESLSGSNNSGGLGYNAQRSLSGSNNSGGIGYWAQRLLSGSNNSGGIGYWAQYQLSGDLNSGGIGYWAQELLSGSNNSGGIGYWAQRLLSGSNNSGGIGYNAQYLAIQNNSIAMGYQAGDARLYPVTGVADTVPRTNIDIENNTISGVNTNLFGSNNEIVLLKFSSERGDSLNFSGTHQATITSSSIIELNRDVDIDNQTAIDTTDLYIQEVAQYDDVMLLGNETVADKSQQSVLGGPNHTEIAFADKKQRLRVGQDITGRDGQAWRLNESTGQMELQPDPVVEKSQASLTPASLDTLVEGVSFTHINGFSSAGLTDFTSTDSTLTYTGESGKDFLLSWGGNIEMNTTSTGTFRVDIAPYVNSWEQTAGKAIIRKILSNESLILPVSRTTILTSLSNGAVISLRNTATTSGTTFYTIRNQNITITEL